MTIKGIEDVMNKLDEGGKLRERMDPLNDYTVKHLEMMMATIDELEKAGMRPSIAAQLIAFELFDTGFSVLIGLGVPSEQVTDAINLVRQRADINMLYQRGTLTAAERVKALAELALPYLDKHGV